MLIRRISNISRVIACCVCSGLETYSKLNEMILIQRLLSSSKTIAKTLWKHFEIITNLKFKFEKFKAVSKFLQLMMYLELFKLLIDLFSACFLTTSENNNNRDWFRRLDLLTLSRMLYRSIAIRCLYWPLRFEY